jgi:hypothetical protein
MRGSGGNSGWNLGIPSFPLVQSGLEGLGTDAMGEVSNLELGPRSWRSGLEASRSARSRRSASAAWRRDW